MKNSARYGKKSVIAVTAILLAAGIAVCPFCFPKQREIVDLAPDFSNTMCLKIDENGRAVFIGSGALFERSLMYFRLL